MSEYLGNRAIVVGASSGIGREVARLLLKDGWTVGLVARRGALLEALASECSSQAPASGSPSEEDARGRAFVREIDVTSADADAGLRQLIDEMGGLDLYFHAAGVGWMNPELEKSKELRTLAVNGVGFARMVGEAYRYFASAGHGQIAVISSIAGTKGLGPAPAYSATKAFEGVYLQALEQQARGRGLDIRFTDIRPGFVRTALIGEGNHFPMVLDPQEVAGQIVAAIYHQRHVVVIDWRWRVLTFFWRLLPRWVWRSMNVHR